MQCPDCGTANRDSASACKQCGGPLPERCPNCKAPVHPSDQHCVTCGRFLGPSGPVAIVYAGPEFMFPPRVGVEPIAGRDPIIRCLACDSVNREDARVCAGCGTDIPKFCSRCRTAARAADRFCVVCGQPFGSFAPAPVYGAPIFRRWAGRK
jgi:hypothetical protein